MKEILQTKSKEFAVEIIKEFKYLNENKEFVLSKQLLRSATSVGALIRESEFAQSKADFLNKLYISLKEANETRYWLELLVETGYIDQFKFDFLNAQCTELIKILVSITKTLKEKK